MKAEAGAPPARATLLTRCRLERNELIAKTAAAREFLPRGRNIAQWVRTMTRMLRIVLRNTGAPRGR